MTPDDLATALDREPFEPLRLRPSDCRTVELRNADEAIVSHQSFYVIRRNPVQRRRAESIRLVNLSAVVAVEPIA